MQIKLTNAAGTIAGYSDPPGDSRLRLSFRVKLEGEAWATFEALCPGLIDLSKRIAAEEEVGAQHIHCHTKIDEFDLCIATRESDDPAVDPVTQLELDECVVDGTKSCVIMLDAEGEGVVAFTVKKRLEKKLLQRLKELKGADLYFTTAARQPQLNLAPEQAA